MKVVDSCGWLEYFAEGGVFQEIAQPVVLMARVGFVKCLEGRQSAYAEFYFYGICI